MRLENERESDNVEDRRGSSGGGGGGGFGLGGRSIGIGGVVIALIASYFLGVDPSVLLGMVDGGGAPSSAQVAPGPAPKPPASDKNAIFVSRVLASTEDTWAQIFKEAGKTYQPPKLALYTRSLPTACGMGQAAMGPFYCPLDRKVYIDLQFFEQMRERFNTASQATQAYIIAHEVGHHVQTLLGISEQMEAQRRGASKSEANALSVRLELQADCFAGVWARRYDQSKQFLEPGDIENAVAAASAIGDDALQRQAQGHVVPDSFTHGTSAQRVAWLKRGLETGDVQACNTFRSRI